jgi:sugar/nucleoside kinase (ribokinase family)
MSLLVTGSIGIDTVHTPRGCAERVLGGSCAYFAAAASFQVPVRVVAAAGGDWPDEHRQLLVGFDNVDLGGLDLRPESQTFAWGGRYMDNMNSRETLFTELGVLEEPPPPIPADFRDSEFVFLANTHPAIQLEFLRQLPACKLSAADSMDLWINVARDELLSLLGEVDGFILNDEEAEQLTGINNAISAGRALLEHGLTFVVVKKGAHGCVLVHRDGLATMPAYPATHDQVVDPTGAGDAFAGGFMGHLASTGSTDFSSLQTALAWGTVTASFVLESFSLRSLASITPADIDERLSHFQAAARVG